MPDNNTNMVSRNDIEVPLVEGKVSKGREQYSYYFPQVEGMENIVKFLGADDALKLLSLAIKDIGRVIHKTIVGNDDKIVPGSAAYVELFQSQLDDWDSTADNKSDLLQELEKTTEIGKAIAMQGMAKGLEKVKVEYVSVHTKESISFEHEIEQQPGQNAMVSAQMALLEALKQSDNLRSRINAIVRKPRTKKATTVATAETTGATAASEVASPTPLVETTAEAVPAS